MEISLQLAKILEKHGLLNQGVMGELAHYLDIHRQTVAKLVRSRAKVVNLEQLSRLCQWLIEHRVPVAELPAGLFGLAAADLWQAVADMQKTVIYFGQYCELQSDGVTPSRLWISRRDVDLANEILGQVFAAHSGPDKHGSLQFQYVPFQYRVAPDKHRERFLSRDAGIAKKVFAQMRRQKAETASILLGAADVNYLVEVFMANFWGLKPFEHCTDKRHPPVYVVLRDPRSDMVSCFGGTSAPPGFSGEALPGIYYLGKDGTWHGVPLRDGKEDAGLVVVVHDPATKSIEAVLFGHTGMATAAMGAHVVRASKPFWPPFCEWSGKQVGVYVCRFLVEKRKGVDADSYHVKHFDAIPLDTKVLRKHIKLGKA